MQTGFHLSVINPLLLRGIMVYLKMLLSFTLKKILVLGTNSDTHLINDICIS